MTEPPCCLRRLVAGRWARQLVLATLGAWTALGCRHELDPLPPSKRAETPASDRHPLSGPLTAAPARTDRVPPPQPEAEYDTEAADAKDLASIRFRDVTEQSGITFVHCSGSSPDKHYPTLFGSGVALIDYDGDGLLDLYFATTRNFPLDAPTRSQGNRLYRNLGGGRFVDVTEKAGVGFRGFTTGLAVGDLDGNGFADLYLANFGPNVLYLNNGDGTFRDASAASGATCGVWSSGVALLDYDGDSRLDLYVSCYGQWTFEGPHPFCGDKAKNVRTVCSPTTIPPQRHFLFRNKGDGTFEDTTAAAGILRRDGRGMGVLAADFDRDGHVDLFVANDLCPNFLFLNRGDGTFDDVSESSGAACSEAGEPQSGMGVDAEDLTGDGYPELVVSHYRGEYCTLYRSLDGRTFQDTSALAGIVQDSMPYVGWGCALADFDRDGEPDLLIVNGHVENNLPQVGRDIPYAEPSKVWRNTGGGKFRAVRQPGSFFATDTVARGAAFGDLDNDGDIDVVVSRMDDRPAILLNESDRGRWIGLNLVGRRFNPPVGALVEIHAGDRVLYRQVKGGGSYYSANDPRLIVGLGSINRIDQVEIHWPGGGRTVLHEPALDRMHRVLEPAGNDAGGTPGRARAPENRAR